MTPQALIEGALRKSVLTFQELKGETGLSPRKLDRFLHRMKDQRKVLILDRIWELRFLSAHIITKRNQPRTLLDLLMIRSFHSMKYPPRYGISNHVCEMEYSTARVPGRRPPPHEINTMEFMPYNVRCGVCNSVLRVWRWVEEEIAPPPPECIRCGAKGGGPIQVVPNTDLVWAGSNYSPRPEVRKKGHQLEMERERRQISQEKLARLVGLSVEDLQRLEMGRGLSPQWALLVSIFEPFTKEGLAAWTDAAWRVPLQGRKRIPVEEASFFNGLGDSYQFTGAWERMDGRSQPR